MNLIILGSQGSGKGTQALFMAEKFGSVHVDLGKVLRKMAKEDSDLGKKLYEIVYVKKELVSDEIVFEALTEEFKKIPLDRGIILDGAPRRIDQIEEVEKAFSVSGRSLDKVVYLNIPREVSIDRVSRRYSCAVCHKHFSLGENLSSILDKCDECGGKVEQRKDDTPEGIEKRLDIFLSQTIPVIEKYREGGMLVEIDGTKNKKEVFEEILEKVGK